MRDAAAQIIDRIQLARDSRTTLRIAGQGSKAELLGSRRGDVLLDLTSHCGVEQYRPEELVITARAGTSLDEVNQTLAEKGQCLAAEPPGYKSRGTVGGVVASGLSGPSRPFRGSLRDTVLGVVMVNGLGERLKFGGEVFKNVAGFDVARLMVGSEGAFGVLLSVSLRVAPLDPAIGCFRKAMPASDAVSSMRAWALKPLPLTGLAWVDGVLHWRIAGAPSVVEATRVKLAGEEDDPTFWTALRDRSLPCFSTLVNSRALVPPSTPPDGDDVCIDWAGSLRWRRGDSTSINNVSKIGESPLCGSGVDPLLIRIKAAFDPGRIFNPDLLHADITA